MKLTFIGGKGTGKGKFEMPSIGDLDKAIDGLRGIEDSMVDAIVKDVQARIATTLAKNIVEGTPVLTGKARRNWFASLGAPSNETTEEVAGVTFTGDPETDEEAARIAAVVKQLRETPVGETFYMTNNLDYVVGLEAGTGSQKAPDGILLVAILRTIEELKQGEG